MDPFEITVEEKVLLIYPQEDGTYIVNEEEIKFAHLYPEEENEEIIWNTADSISSKFLKEIGMAIENHERE